MLKGRPTRAATARQAQQATTQRFDFKVEEEAEEAVIIASPDSKVSVSLGEALHSLNPEQSRRFIDLVGQSEFDQILREEAFSQQSPEDIFNNEELLKGLEIWSTPSFNDEELQKRFEDESRRLDNVSAGILEISNYDVRFDIKAGSSTEAYEPVKCFSLDLEEKPKKAVVRSNKPIDQEIKETPEEAVTIAPEKFKKSPNRASSPGPSAGPSKLSRNRKKRFKMQATPESINNNNHVTKSSEDSYDKLILEEDRKAQKKASAANKTITDPGDEDNLFREKISTPQVQIRRSARNQKDDDWKPSEHDEEACASLPNTLVECPLCNRLFAVDEIEFHADTCGEDGAVGGEPAEEEEVGARAKGNILRGGKKVCTICNRSFTRTAAYESHPCRKDDN